MQSPCGRKERGSGCQKKREDGPAAGAERAPAACSDRRLVMWARARPPHALRTEPSLQSAWPEAAVCALPPDVLPFSNRLAVFKTSIKSMSEESVKARS